MTSLTPVSVRGKRGRHNDIPIGNPFGNKSTSNEDVIVDPPLSTLERLPVELLTQIFIDSGNVSFALSSPYLNAVLSSKLVHREFLARFIREFDEDLDSYDHGRLIVDKAGISQVVPCHWFTNAFMEAFAHKLRPGDCAELHDLWKEECPGGLEFDFRSVEVPLRLLYYPLSNDDEKLLATMIDGFAKISTDNYKASQAAYHVAAAAIKKNDLRPLLCMLDSGSCLKPFMMDLLSTAILEAPFDRVIVWYLLMWVAMNPPLSPNLNLRDPALWQKISSIEPQEEVNVPVEPGSQGPEPRTRPRLYNRIDLGLYSTNRSNPSKWLQEIFKLIEQHVTASKYQPHWLDVTSQRLARGGRFWPEPIVERGTGEV
jgi:hypothetical protein